MDYRVWLFLTVTAMATHSSPGPAPADEYFGPAQMSPIEITNRINDAERRGMSYSALTTVQDAIEDWTRRYPADPWIPPREYRMSHLFGHLRTHSGNADAARCRWLLRDDFAGNRYAIAAERESQPHRDVAKTSAKPAASPKPAIAKNAKKRHRFLGIVF